MWKVSTTPINYHPPNGEGFCIIDEDGDIHQFYFTKEKAQDDLKLLKGED
jgi:hypothetical protein